MYLVGCAVLFSREQRYRRVVLIEVERKRQTLLAVREECRWRRGDIASTIGCAGVMDDRGEN